MKPGFAGLFILIGLLFTAAVSYAIWPHAGWGWRTTMVLLPVFYGLTATAIVLFHVKGRAAQGDIPMHPADRALSLDNAGQLVTKNFEARRALLIEEVDYEGSQYFIEMKNGRVLYLRGQYLYDYEPSDEDQPLKFPTAFFTVRRHKEKGYVVDILRHGDLIPVEVVVPPAGKRLKREFAMEDGTIISHMSFDEIKADIVQSAVDASSPSRLDSAI